MDYLNIGKSFSFKEMKELTISQLTTRKNKINNKIDSFIRNRDRMESQEVDQWRDEVSLLNKARRLLLNPV